LKHKQIPTCRDDDKERGLTENNRQPSKFESQKAKKSKFEEIHKIYLFFFQKRCIIIVQLNSGELDAPMSADRLRGR